MSMKINKLEIENVKRVKAVKIEPAQNGLTVIGGKNKQGKTSVLDSIAWILGGNRFKPSEPHRKGSVLPPELKIVMNNGLVVERKGKNSDLKIIDTKGNKGGQALLDEFVEQLALDLPRFMQSNNKDKAQTLLQIIGVGDKLYELEKQEQELYNQRHALGQIADQKTKFAREQPYYPDAPKEPVSASSLIKEQQEILARNGENQRQRENLKANLEKLSGISDKIIELERTLKKLQEEEKELEEIVFNSRKTVEELQDESTAELEKSIQEIDEINTMVRKNQDKAKAEEDAATYREHYDALTINIEEIRKEKLDLLKGAELPLEGLSVEDGELTYEGYKWDNISGSDQLKVATAIIRKLKPNCGFVLIDKLEQFDLDTLKEFGEWLEKEGLQAIATRVSTGEECSIIIEDGYVVGQEETLIETPVEAPALSWD